MILEKNQLEKLTLGEINSYKYLVLNVEHTIYDYISKQLKNAIEIVNFISKMKRVNKTLERLKINKTINVSILYEAIEVIMNEEHFTDSQIERLVELHTLNNEFEDCFTELMEISNYLPSDVELALFGFQKKDIIKNKDDYYGHFVDKVFELQYDAINKRISVTDFINKSRKLYDALPREENLKLSA